MFLHQVIYNTAVATICAMDRKIAIFVMGMTGMMIMMIVMMVVMVGIMVVMVAFSMNRFTAIDINKSIAESTIDHFMIEILIKLGFDNMSSVVVGVGIFTPVVICTSLRNLDSGVQNQFSIPIPVNSKTTNCDQMIFFDQPNIEVVFN